MSFNSDIFPHLGAFPGEVGSGASPGGIGGPWPMQLPLNYFWNFGSRRGSNKKTIKRKTSKRKSIKRKSIKSKSIKSKKKSLLIRPVNRFVEKIVKNRDGYYYIWSCEDPNSGLTIRGFKWWKINKRNEHKFI